MLRKELYIIIVACLIVACNRSDLDVNSGKPNIVILFADDLGYADLGCQGSDDIRTPNIDKMASEGVRFTSGYVTAPQCGPSRAGLMTGINQARFGYMDNKGNHGLPAKEIAPTMAEYMKENGYATGIIGKWHLGDEPENPTEVIEGSRAWNRGFDYVLMHSRGMSHNFPYRKDGIERMKRRDILEMVIDGAFFWPNDSGYVGPAANG